MEIAYLRGRDAAKTDTLETYGYINGELNKIRERLAAQDVKNAQIEGTFAVLGEKIACCKNEFIMATKEQLIKAIHTFIENDMLPKAEGNYKIILGVAKAALHLKPDSVFEVIKKNSIVEMLGVIDEHDNIDMDILVKILSEGFGSEEFCFAFRVLGKEYAMHFSAADIQTIKRYM